MYGSSSLNSSWVWESCRFLDEYWEGKSLSIWLMMLWADLKSMKRIWTSGHFVVDGLKRLEIPGWGQQRFNPCIINREPTFATLSEQLKNYWNITRLFSEQIQPKCFTANNWNPPKQLRVYLNGNEVVFFSCYKRSDTKRSVKHKRVHRIPTQIDWLRHGKWLHGWAGGWGYAQEPRNWQVSAGEREGIQSLLEELDQASAFG